MKALTKNVMAIIMVILSLILALGSVFWFHSCGSMEDGSYMSCHWAQHAVTFCGGILSALSLLRLVLPKKWNVAGGLALASAILAAGTAILPGNVIALCMMNDMRCQSIMRPAVMVICVLLCAASVIDLIFTMRSSRSS